jgi:hypothetical protein
VDDDAKEISGELEAWVNETSEKVEPDAPGDAVCELESQAAGGLVKVNAERIAANRWRVTFLRQGTNIILNQDKGDLSSASTRSRMIQKVIKRLGAEVASDQSLADQLEQRLLQAAAASEAASGGGAIPVVGAVDYAAIVDEDDPEATGFYAVGEKHQQRLTNLVMRIEEELIIGDVDEEREDKPRRFRGTINVAGQTSRFDITSKQFAEDLRSAIFEAAGSRVQLLGSIDLIRTAISRNSDAVVRDVLTSPGWNADFSRYLFPGGFVDRDGCHPTAEGDGVPVIDLSRHEKARWLGLRPLDAEELRRVKRHILDDLMLINDREVVSAMLAAVVLPIAMRAAGIGSWPLVWLAGLTGSGKSLLACLCANFYGDFGPQGSGRHMAWKSTGMSILAEGYSFRDALYLVDDYKREDVKHSDCVMVLQCYGDRSGRSRLKSDATMNTTKAIRGLMVCTGEDFPESNASGLGRTVVIRVPNPERDYERADRCRGECHLYRGWTAAFIAHFIRNDLGKRFKERVDHWQRVYLKRIRGRTNDARIATNHACLAAAFELFAEFMSDVWGAAEAKHAARAFAEEYVAGLVLEAAGAVEEETAGRIYLSVLAELVAFGLVRIKGIGPTIDPDDTTERDRIVGELDRRGSRAPQGVGQLSDDDAIWLSIRLSLAAVQQHLRRQGRQPLQIGERALLDQLAALGFLLDADDRPISAEDAGEKTTKTRVGGRSINAARVRAAALRLDRDERGDSQPETSGTTETPLTLPFPATGS